MRQRSLDNLLTPPGDYYRISWGFHYDADSPPECIIAWCKTRFERFVIMCPEVSKTGLRHIQGYGETDSPVTKSERQMFQGKGRFAKYLNRDVLRAWWFRPSRKNRQSNIMYVLKDAHKDHVNVSEYNPDLNVDDLEDWVLASYEMNHVERVAPVDPTKKATTYQDKLLFWYTDKPVDERPTSVKPLMFAMLNENIIPWGNVPNSRIIAAAEWLLLNATKGDVRERILHDKMLQLERLYDSM